MSMTTAQDILKAFDEKFPDVSFGPSTFHFPHIDEYEGIKAFLLSSLRQMGEAVRPQSLPTNHAEYKGQHYFWNEFDVNLATFFGEDITEIKDKDGKIVGREAM